MAPDAARLARWIVGQELPAPPWTDASQTDAVLELAASEGVVCLLARRVEAATDGTIGWAGALQQAARQESLTSMLLEGETRRVLGVLQAQGMASLLLKGSALAHWAYAEPQWRACGDVDVLVPSREAAQRLAAALEALGFVWVREPGALVSHELTCTRQVTPDWVLEVDIHWKLNNSIVFADVFGFDELLQASIPLPGLGDGARGLGPVHALLHAAVHRARNLENGVGDRLKWLYDFVALGRLFSPGDWARLEALAQQKQLAGVTWKALEAARDMLAMELPGGVLDRLRTCAATEPLDADRLGDWRYMQRQAWRSLPGAGARVRWLWQRIFPAAAYLRQAYGIDGNYAVLMGERMRRFWTKWRAP